MRMNFLAALIFILVLQNCAKGVDPNRPCKELSNAQGAKSYELRSKNGYFTLVNHGSTSAAELEYERCDTSFVNTVQRDLPNGGSKDTRQRLRWPETGGGEKQQNIPSGLSAPNFGASRDVVVTVEEKPTDQEKERLVVVDRNPDAGKEVPAYVIVSGPKLDRDSKNQDQMVTLSLDTLNILIRDSLSPPSGPSMDHNWYVTSLPDQKGYEGTADQMLVFRVVPSGEDVVNVADALPGFQEAADGTYRIKD